MVEETLIIKEPLIERRSDHISAAQSIRETNTKVNKLEADITDLRLRINSNDITTKEIKQIVDNINKIVSAAGMVMSFLAILGSIAKWFIGIGIAIGVGWSLVVSWKTGEPPSIKLQ